MTTLYLKFPCLHVINRPQKQNNINTSLTITITRHTYPTPTHILKINHCYNCSVILFFEFVPLKGSFIKHKRNKGNKQNDIRIHPKHTKLAKNERYLQQKQKTNKKRRTRTRHTIWLQCKARPAAPGRCQSTAPAPGRSVSYYRSPQPGRAAGALPRRSGRALTPARAAPGRLNEATRGRHLPPTRPASRQPTARWIGVSRAGPAGRPPRPDVWCCLGSATS